MNYIFLIFVLSVVIFHPINVFAAGDKRGVAEDAHSEGRKDVQDNFLSLFLSASLSARLLNEERWDASHEYRPLYKSRIAVRRDDLHANYPWIEQLLYPAVAPRLLSINRWAHSPEITVLFEHNFTSLENVSSVPFILTVGNIKAGVPTPEAASFSASEEFQTLRSFVSQSARAISAVTGMRLFLNKVDRPALGAINIVLVSNNTLGGTHYKLPSDYSFSVLNSWTNTDYVDLRGVYGLEREFPHAIKFSPTFPDQVDGYFVTNENNEIEFSMCYIWSGHNDDTIKSLALECLVRSMGLPGGIRPKHSPSILSSWSKHGETLEVVAGGSTDPLTDIDKRLLSTLYLPQLHTGMSITEVETTLGDIVNRKGIK